MANVEDSKCPRIAIVMPWIWIDRYVQMNFDMHEPSGQTHEKQKQISKFLWENALMSLIKKNPVSFELEQGLSPLTPPGLKHH